MSATALVSEIPHSEDTVQVSIIDTTLALYGVPHKLLLSPEIPGWAPPPMVAYSLLIEHSSGRSVLYDLGLRKDWENLSPMIVEMIKILDIEVKKDIPEILAARGISVDDIEAIIPSHWHFEHMGDPSKFPSTTALIVGPGFKEMMMPGYPTNPNALLLDSDFKGREVRELSFEDAKEVAGFEALDYFGDGSFYILNSPGHAVGHLAVLARTTSGPSTFILGTGDCVHHPGELRPSALVPLPHKIMPNPLAPGSHAPCLGHKFDKILRSKSEPVFVTPDIDENPMKPHNMEQHLETVTKCIVNDAQESLFVVMAHDSSLEGIVQFFPRTANGWQKHGWAKKARWAFLGEFEGVLRGETGETEQVDSGVEQD